MYFEGDRWRVWPMVNIVLTGGEGNMATMLGSHRLTRRAFLGVAAASAGAVAAATAGPGGLRWTDWPAGTATATTATGCIRSETGPAAASAASSAAPSATAGSWRKGAAHGPAPHTGP